MNGSYSAPFDHSFVMLQERFLRYRARSVLRDSTEQ